MAIVVRDPAEQQGHLALPSQANDRIWEGFETVTANGGSFVASLANSSVGADKGVDVVLSRPQDVVPGNGRTYTVLREVVRGVDLLNTRPESFCVLALLWSAEIAEAAPSTSIVEIFDEAGATWFELKAGRQESGFGVWGQVGGTALDTRTYAAACFSRKVDVPRYELRSGWLQVWVKTLDNPATHVYPRVEVRVVVRDTLTQTEYVLANIQTQMKSNKMYQVEIRQEYEVTA